MGNDQHKDETDECFYESAWSASWIRSFLDQTLPGSDSTWNIWRYSSGCPTGIIIREVNIRWTQRKENVGGHPCTFIQVYIEEKTWRVQFFIKSCFLSPIHTPYPSRVYSTQFNISSAELTQYLALQMAGSYMIPLKWWRTIWYRNLYFASFEPHMEKYQDVYSLNWY